MGFSVHTGSARLWKQIPYSTEQGIFYAEQGILALEQGILPSKFENIAG
jgi:hypothetical protein